jgi:hypothetical protein
MEGQAQRFRDKSGRDPRPEDPIFFDPDTDEPRPRPGHGVSRDDRGLRQTGRETGADPTLIEARCELGYVVTDDNRRLFSASDILAWEATVRHHTDNVDDEGDLDGENKLDKNFR